MLKRILFLFSFLFCISQVNQSLFASSNIQKDTIQQLIDSCIQLRKDSYQLSNQLCEKTIKKAIKELNYKHLPKLYKVKGVNFWYQSLYDSTMVYYRKSLSLYKQAGSKLDVGKMTINIGTVYEKKSQFDKAVSYLLEGLKIYESINYERGYGGVYQSLGNIFFRQEQFNKAQKYYNKAIKSNLKANKNISGLLINLGAVKQAVKDYEGARDCYFRAIEEVKDLDNKVLLGNANYNLGYFFRVTNQLDSAYFYLKESEKIRKEIGSHEGLIYSKFEIAQIEITKKNYKLAEQYINQIYQIAQDNGAIDWMLDIIPELIHLNKLKGNYKKALILQDKLIEMKDSINIMEVKEKLNVLLEKYEKEQREKEIELLEKKTEIQKLKLGKKNAWIIILLFILLLGFFAVFVSLRINRLRADHRIMDLRQKVLLTQMNPHFLFNALTSIQSFILDERNIEANNYLARLASLVRGILENSREEFVSLQVELDTLSDYIEMQKLRFENDISYQFELDERIDINEVLVPPMLAQPFVENALIHGKLRNNPEAKILIKVELLEKKQSIKFQIIDNGIGIDAAMKQSGDKVHRSLATSIAMDRVKIYNFKSKSKMNFEIIDLKHIDPNLTGTKVAYTIPLVNEV